MTNIKLGQVCEMLEINITQAVLRMDSTENLEQGKRNCNFILTNSKSISAFISLLNGENKVTYDL